VDRGAHWRSEISCRSAMSDKRDTDRLVVLIVVLFIVAAVAMAVLLLFPTNFSF
jgi:hypothetical protein